MRERLLEEAPGSVPASKGKWLEFVLMLNNVGGYWVTRDDVRGLAGARQRFDTELSIQTAPLAKFKERSWTELGFQWYELIPPDMSSPLGILRLLWTLVVFSVLFTRCVVSALYSEPVFIVIHVFYFVIYVFAYTYVRAHLLVDLAGMITQMHSSRSFENQAKLCVYLFAVLMIPFLVLGNYTQLLVLIIEDHEKFGQAANWIWALNVLHRNFVVLAFETSLCTMIFITLCANEFASRQRQELIGVLQREREADETSSLIVTLHWATKRLLDDTCWNLSYLTLPFMFLLAFFMVITAFQGELTNVELLYVLSNNLTLLCMLMLFSRVTTHCTQMVEWVQDYVGSQAAKPGFERLVQALSYIKATPAGCTVATVRITSTVAIRYLYFLFGATTLVLNMRLNLFSR